MRIGYLYNMRAYPPRSGNCLHATELVQGFLRCGNSVFVIDDPTMPSVTNYNNTSMIEEFIKKIDILYIRIDGRFTRNWYVMNKCMNLATYLPIVWEINSPGNEGLAFSWLGGSFEDNVIIEGKIRKFRRLLHASRKLPGIWLEESHRRHMGKYVDAAICVSSILAKYAKDELGIEKALVLPNGGPLLTEKEIIQRRKKRKYNRFTVLYTGSSIYPWQGLNYLSHVIKTAEYDVPDILFILIINKIVPGLPKTDNVLILNNPDREVILDVICNSDASVSLHPEYPWSRYNFHNSPIKLFEYMSCMVPVIASNHGQMADIIRDGVDGLLCNNNTEDILKKILYLKNNKEEAKKIGKRGWEKIQLEYNWNRNVSVTLNLFNNLIMNKRHKN